MFEAVHIAVIVCLLTLLLLGSYYRVQSQRSREPLDRTKEGWPILIGVRALGFLTAVSTVVWLWKPAWFAWASYPIPLAVRWMGVAGLACAVVWLIWMFHALGRNLTDTVVTRRDAYFVDYGPYRFVRNPMYTGVLLLGLSLGLALETWLLPVLTSLTFALLALRTRKEEQYLIEHFGDPYRTYIKRVGRFLPKLSG
ncbi:MAG TPA: isoprenylcysteine carboxylmethyltransferase family protein [Bryobacteraceae bacterium]|nr:isoprenylcysteine carboxylmethyltransferase family protein [Bryobacteraceae bacterium]